MWIAGQMIPAVAMRWRCTLPKLTLQTIEIEGNKALIANLKRVGLEAPKALAAAMMQEAEQIMTEAKVLVPVDLGNLRATGHVAPPVIEGTTVTVALGFGGPAAPYAVYVHEGTGPAVGRPAFMPPVEAIKPWMRRHEIPEEYAFPIARAIGQRGLPPTKYLETPAKARTAGMAARMAQTVKRYWERIVDRGVA